MTYRHRKIHRRLAHEAYALGWAVPEVVTHRMARLCLAGDTLSARDRAEMYRMTAEKFAAFYESWNAMFLAIVRANMQLALSPMWWAWFAPTSRRTAQLSAHGQRAAGAALAAGLAPVRRRAVANAKRLRRLRR
jgi:hypothetical protein